MQLVDSHGHLQTRPFATDAEAVLRAAHEAGLVRLLVPGFDVPTCLSKAAWRGQDLLQTCSFGRDQALNQHVYEIEQRAAKGLGHASVVDLSDLMCAGATCRPLIDGRVAYRDSHHLTVGVSRSFAPALLERVRPRLPGGF